MTCLSVLLTIKILITMIAVVLPFMFRPAASLAAYLGIESSAGLNPMLFRLYAVSIFSLLVGYGGGIWRAEYGVFPWVVAIVGVVSNSGATAVLLVHGRRKKRWIGVMFFGGIAAGLMLAMIIPNWALYRL